MPPRRRSRRFSSRSKVVTGWVNHSLPEQTISVGTTNISDMLDGLSAAGEESVRKILGVSWQATFGLNAANVEHTGRWGMIVVTQRAFAGTDVPRPLSDHQYPWYWNEAFHIDEPDLRERTIVGQTKTTRLIPSKNETLMFAIESSPLSGANFMKYGFSFRILYAKG